MGCRNAEKGHAGGCWRTALVDSITQPILPNPAVFKILDLDDFWFIYISAWRGGRGTPRLANTVVEEGRKSAPSSIYQNHRCHILLTQKYTCARTTFLIQFPESVQLGGEGEDISTDVRTFNELTSFLSLRLSLSFASLPSLV